MIISFSKHFMAKYVDGFVITIPEKNLPEYRKMAELGAKTWMKYGALDYKECLLDDATPEHVVFAFPTMAKANKGETVVFAFIVFESRTHRDEVNAKVMSDPAMNQFENQAMPFEMDRFAYGGFEVIVDGR